MAAMTVDTNIPRLIRMLARSTVRRVLDAGLAWAQDSRPAGNCRRAWTLLAFAVASVLRDAPSIRPDDAN